MHPCLKKLAVGDVIHYKWSDSNIILYPVVPGIFDEVMITVGNGTQKYPLSNLEGREDKIAKIVKAKK